MRLPGKKGKEKEADSKSQAVGNINRLICTSKHQHSLLQGNLITKSIYSFLRQVNLVRKTLAAETQNLTTKILQSVIFHVTHKINFGPS